MKKKCKIKMFSPFILLLYCIFNPFKIRPAQCLETILVCGLAVCAIWQVKVHASFCCRVFQVDFRRKVDMEKVILKVKVESENINKWVLHKTDRNKSLQDIAVEILFGGNPCVDLTEEIFSGIDRHVEAAEFGSIANVERNVATCYLGLGEQNGKETI